MQGCAIIGLVDYRLAHALPITTVDAGRAGPDLSCNAARNHANMTNTVGKNVTIADEPYVSTH